MTKETLKQALEAFEALIDKFSDVSAYEDEEHAFTNELIFIPDIKKAIKAIAAAKQALALPEQEPVARVIDNGTPEGATEWIPFTNRVEPLKTGDLLYTTPPQRPWVGLTDEEIWTVLQFRGYNTDTIEIAKAIEAKLKEKP